MKWPVLVSLTGRPLTPVCITLATNHQCLHWLLMTVPLGTHDMSAMLWVGQLGHHFRDNDITSLEYSDYAERIHLEILS